MARAMKDSGVEWIGEIPEEWQVKRLKFSMTCKDGERIPVDSAQRIKGPYPYWGAGSITDYVSDYLFDEELVLLGEDGAPFFEPYRPVAFLVNEKIWVNNHIHVLKPHKTEAPAFMAYALNSVDYHPHINGSILSKLTQGNMREIALPSTSLLEQQRIANYLDTRTSDIDASIAKTQESIEEYKKLKQAVITQAVTKGIRPGRVMKDSGVEWIGEIPEEWDITTFKRLGTCRNGLTYSPDDLCSEQEGTLVLRASNIQNGKLDFTDSVYVRGVINDAVKVHVGDILICSRNGSARLIGKNALIDHTINAAFGAFMMVYKCASPEYIRYILSSHLFSYNLHSFLTATVNQLTAKKFLNIRLCYTADEEEQHEIVAYLDEKCAAIDTLIEKKQAIITELEAYKKSLIYEYVTGKKEVPMAT